MLGSATDKSFFGKDVTLLLVCCSTLETPYISGSCI